MTTPSSRPGARPAGRATPPARLAPHAKRTPFVLLLLGLVVGGLCALLALNTAAAANEVQRHDLALRDQNIAADLVQLQNDRQASAAPANLAAAAEALGMVPGANPGFLEVQPDGRVKVAGSAAPATAAPLPVPTPTPTHHRTTKHTSGKATQHQKSAKSKQPSKQPSKQHTKSTGAKQPSKQHTKSTGAKQPSKQNKTSKAKHSPGTTKRPSKQNKNAKPGNAKHSKHHTQSGTDHVAGAPTRTKTITIPGGPR